MKIMSAAVLAAAALLSTESALAIEYVGAFGTVAQVSVNGDKSDDYFGARGRLVIDEGQQNYQTYQWAGTACNGRNMSDADVASLLMALQERRSVTVTPIWKMGAGGARCLVAYRITANEVPQ